MKKPFQLVNWFGLIFFIMALGTSGFMIIENYDLLDAVYMTVITVTTIGYFEVVPLTPTGKIFNIFLIITSFTTFTYALARLTQFIASGEMALFIKNRKLMNALAKMENHVIICGLGRNGRQAAHTLKAHLVDFVVVESKGKNIDEWLENDPSLVYINGDATDDATLIKAGISKAKALIIALPADADNVFIVLSARSLNQHIQIISRASNHSSIIKLKKAGANNIIMPDKIGGTHMATLVSKPDVVEFIDFLSGEEGESINMESLDYENLPGHLKDKTLKEVMSWKNTGINCIGVKNINQKFMINPPQNTIIAEGMKVIVLGTRTQIHAMKDNFAENASSKRL